MPVVRADAFVESTEIPASVVSLIDVAKLVKAFGSAIVRTLLWKVASALWTWPYAEIFV